MKNYLEKRVQELNVAHAVRFLGFVPHWEFLELLNACDIVCLPSRNEPFGIALLEAWAAEKPVVATDVGGLGENIDNFINGVKVYVNPDSVAWGINYLLNSPGEMHKIALEGSKKVLKFSWRNIINKLINVYNMVLKAK
jgi:glycosyltransferase involved in cell wall biosynthesis